jgi:hypothetical protein
VAGGTTVTDEQYDALWAVAQGLFPRSVEAGSEKVQRAWRRLLDVLTLDEACYALEELARTSGAFPESPAQLLQAGYAVRKERTPKLAMPARPAVVPDTAEQLRQFDAAADGYLGHAASELADFCRRHHLRDGEPVPCPTCQTHLTRLEQPGPWAQRAREVIAGTATPGEGIDALFASMAVGSRRADGREAPTLATRIFADTTSPQERLETHHEGGGAGSPEGDGQGAVHAARTSARAIGDGGGATTPPRTAEEPPEDEALRLANRWVQDHSAVDPNALEPGLRAQVGEILRRWQHERRRAS